MLKKMLSLSLLILFGRAAVSVSGYDPGAEQIKRLEILEKTCKKYDDDLTYEYPGMVLNVITTYSCKWYHPLDNTLLFNLTINLIAFYFNPFVTILTSTYVP